MNNGDDTRLATDLKIDPAYGPNRSDEATDRLAVALVNRTDAPLPNYTSQESKRNGVGL